MGHFCFVTLFESLFQTAMHCSVIGRAVEQGAVSYDIVQIRDFAHDRHRRVDDAPYGGGAGQVMKPEPTVEAIEYAKAKCGGGHVILMCPQGKTFCQADAVRLSRLQTPIILVCGHYEGYDERIRAFADEEISIGDFILTGGEIGAIAVSDAVARLWQGVLGNSTSAEDESFSHGWLEYPQYTRPPEFRGMKVPDILLQGNHAAIDLWRHCESIRRTKERRPDIFQAKESEITYEEKCMLGWEIPRQKKSKSRHHSTKSQDLQNISSNPAEPSLENNSSDILPPNNKNIDN